MTTIDRIVDQFGAGDFDLRDHLAMACYVGSMSHNTHNVTQIDDVDVMGMVVPPACHLIGLGNWQHWVKQFEELDVVLYSHRKLISLLLKGNPNVMGVLWLKRDHYLHRNWAFTLLEHHRDAFVSKQAHAAFVGYAKAQLDRMQRGAYKGYMGEKRKALVDRFGYDPKNAAHLIRLLRMGTEFLETGELQVWRTHDADELRAIKRGEWSLERIQKEAEDGFERAREALERSHLPEQPDYARAETVLMEISRWAIDRERVYAGTTEAP